MIYRDFKGLKLSALGFGTMRLPVKNGVYSDIDEEKVAEMFSYAIAHGYGTLAVRIVNRSGTDICPMEKAVAQISDPAEAFSALRKKMHEMGWLNA